MLPCDEVRELAEEYLSGTLDTPCRREVAHHLRVCQHCHLMVEEARLARRVLHQAGAPPPPPRLAARIKLAALTRLTFRPRPLHERALGSPAFLAVCASLLCGAVMCLLAIMRVASVQPNLEAPAPTVEVVAEFHLPARDVTAVAAVGIPQSHHARETLRGGRPQPPALVNVAVKVASGLGPVTMGRGSAPRPQRALMAVTTPAPHMMSSAPTLPTPSVVLAGARTSRPDMAQPPSLIDGAGARIVPVAVDDDADMEVDDLAAPGPPRGDFTSAR